MKYETQKAVEAYMSRHLTEVEYEVRRGDDDHLVGRAGDLSVAVNTTNGFVGIRSSIACEAPLALFIQNSHRAVDVGRAVQKIIEADRSKPGEST